MVLLHEDLAFLRVANVSGTAQQTLKQSVDYRYCNRCGVDFKLVLSYVRQLRDGCERHSMWTN